MEKKNTLEIIGFTLIIIGALFFISKNYYIIEALSSVYESRDIILPLGLFIWDIGYMKKAKEMKAEF
ncbi:hypothetical protein DFQ03_2165 [Maribacter caenipelagi]|uniref:Uncharacterized protein n=1 Tax=Maribacter caenipelagi TaxID=1447781 RepID=A0A4R7D3B2_9FLAO|nr:hypothetical protein [Maribacter caenipelagi]TDS15523.1 hypothetical protein DFQ03_2165 [Maribacter caenipelagi]